MLASWAWAGRARQADCAGGFTRGSVGRDGRVGQARESGGRIGGVVGRARARRLGRWVRRAGRSSRQADRSGGRVRQAGPDHLGRLEDLEGTSFNDSGLS